MLDDIVEKLFILQDKSPKPFNEASIVEASDILAVIWLVDAVTTVSDCNFTFVSELATG